MAKLLAARRGDTVPVEGVLDPANPDRDLVADGALLPGPHATLAGPTFEEWLRTTADTPGRSAGPSRRPRARASADWHRRRPFDGCWRWERRCRHS